MNKEELEEKEFQKVYELIEGFEKDLESNDNSIKTIKTFEKNNYRMTMYFYRDYYLVKTHYLTANNHSIGHYESHELAEEYMNKTIIDINNNIELVEGHAYDF